MTHMPSAQKDARVLAAVESQVFDLDVKHEHAEHLEKQSATSQHEREVDQFGAGLEKSEEERRLVRKLDFRIIPCLWVMYWLNYLDRSAIAQARLNGLERHLGLVGSQYNVCISILFVGYTVVQIPSNMIMSTKKIRPSVWMCSWMLAWAVISACTALSKDYTGLVVTRFLLGIAEAPFYPGAIYLLSLFYTRREIATRIGLLYSANICAISFSGLIAAGIFATLDGRYGLRGWQFLFIIEGIITFGVASAAFFILPDHPLTTRWLTPEERQLAQSRMDRDTVGLEASRGPIAGLKQAVSDPKLWLLVLMQTLHLAACGFNSFFPTIVQALGFVSQEDKVERRWTFTDSPQNPTITLVMTCPPYLLSGVVAVLYGMSSGKFNERTIHITIAMCVAAVGFIISCVTLNVAARYVSCFIFTIGAYACNSIILGWVSATCGQTSEKKAASLSIVNTFANASFIYTPYLYPASDGPKYVTANAANTAFVLCSAGCAWALRFWLKAENKKLVRENSKLLFAY